MLLATKCDRPGKTFNYNIQFHSIADQGAESLGLDYILETMPGDLNLLIFQSHLRSSQNTYLRSHHDNHQGEGGEAGKLNLQESLVLDRPLKFKSIIKIGTDG